jgi:hypothetical protein
MTVNEIKDQFAYFASIVDSNFDDHKNNESCIRRKSENLISAPPTAPPSSERQETIKNVELVNFFEDEPSPGKAV